MTRDTEVEAGEVFLLQQEVILKDNYWMAQTVRY